MKIAELRNLSAEELKQREKTIKADLFKLNSQRYSGRVEKPHMYSVLKKEIAQIKTILNTQKEKSNG
jgi:large subunit ribosomal protein L29